MGSEIKLLQIFALRIFFSALKNSEVTLFFFFPPEIEICEVLPVLWDPTKERKRCHNTGSPDAPAISAWKQFYITLQAALTQTTCPTVTSYCQALPQTAFANRRAESDPASEMSYSRSFTVKTRASVKAAQLLSSRAGSKPYYQSSFFFIGQKYVLCLNGNNALNRKAAFLPPEVRISNTAR